MIKRLPAAIMIPGIILWISAACSTKGKKQNGSQHMKAIEISELSTEQVKDWNTLFEPWVLKNFGECLRMHNFKMDCIDCGNIIMDVVLEIDDLGTLKEYTILETDFDCAHKSELQIEALSQCMMAYFTELNYPKSLHNIKLKTRIGSVTKC